MIGAAFRLATEWLRAGSVWRQSCAAGPPVVSDACAGCESFPLTELSPDRPARVSCLVDPAGPATAKLAALGLLPGVRLRVLQRSPMQVIRIGYTDLALDAGLAACIRVVLEIPDL